MTSSQAPLFLMCRPAHFAVTYAINPWMDPETWARDDRALGAESWQEWAALHQAELMADWQLARQLAPLNKIDPLE